MSTFPTFQSSSKGATGSKLPETSSKGPWGTSPPTTNWLSPIIDRYQHVIEILKTGSPLRIATDCSGLDTPITALNLVGIPYEHIFSSDINESSKKFILQNHKPHTFYNNLIGRKFDTNLKLDLYVAGFPCQPFSTLGKQCGINDKRGKIFFHIADFIENQQPNIFILENVKRIKTIDGGATFKIILDRLSQIGGQMYTIHHHVLNTCDYGLPQSRNRVYIVGIKKILLKNQLSFPEKLQTNTNISDLILDHEIYQRDLSPQLSKVHQRGYGELAPHMSKILGLLPEIDSRQNSIYNLNVSNLQWFRKGKYNLCPCLSTQCNYYLPYYQRTITPYEAALLQGIPLHTMNTDNLSDRQLYRLVGNAMSCNVILCIILQTLEGSWLPRFKHPLAKLH